MVTLIKSNNHIDNISRNLIISIYDRHEYDCQSTINPFILYLLQIFSKIKIVSIHGRGSIFYVGFENPHWLDRLQRIMIDDYIFERK